MKVILIMFGLPRWRIKIVVKITNLLLIDRCFSHIF